MCFSDWVSCLCHHTLHWSCSHVLHIAGKNKVLGPQYVVVYFSLVYGNICDSIKTYPNINLSKRFCKEPLDLAWTSLSQELESELIVYAKSILKYISHRVTYIYYLKSVSRYGFTVYKTFSCRIKCFDIFEYIMYKLSTQTL